MKNINDLIQYVNDHQLKFEQDLFECLKIPSISTLSDHHSDIIECAQHVMSHLNTIGLNNIKSFNGYGNPIVYADNGFDETRPTVLFYGHYDVQPVDPLDLWDTPPFSPTIRDDYIFARGASDNKGMFYAQLKAIETYLNVNGTCPINVKVLIEGEEEIGSNGLTQFIKDYQELLIHDVMLVSDNPKFSDELPSICKSIRGLVYLDVHVEAINYDVHSGQLGGGVPNVIHYVSKCISSLKDPKTNKVLIPDFYDQVQIDSNSIKNFPADNLDSLKTFYNLGEHANADFFNNIWFLPTLDCNGILSGFTEDGAKTVIPAKASFKLSSRLVHNQNPDDVFNLIKDYIKSYFPDSFKVKVKQLGPLAKPMMVDTENSFFKKALQALEVTHNKSILIQGEGGSIPILAEFQSLYKTPIILIGMNSPNDNIHAPNERFKRSDYMDGIKVYINLINLISNGVTH